MRKLVTTPVPTVARRGESTVQPPGRGPPPGGGRAADLWRAVAPVDGGAPAVVSARYNRIVDQRNCYVPANGGSDVRTKVLAVAVAMTAALAVAVGWVS